MHYLINNEASNKKKYIKIIKKQKQEIEFLKKELEEIEIEEIFNEGR